MNKFPRSFIEKVKKATDMLALAREYTSLTSVGEGIYGGCCPHPQHKDSTPSFRVWEKEQSWCCMSCHSGKKDDRFKNYGSDCFAFIQWVNSGKLSWPQAVTELANRAGIALPDDVNQQAYDQIRDEAVAYYNALTPAAIEYLNGRGLDEEDIAEWGIGFDGSRITFPLPDAYCNLLAFSRRQFIDLSGPKYKNSSTSAIFQKGTYLYGVHKLDRTFPEIRITEGQLDVILALKHGVRNIIGTLGTAFTEHHVSLIQQTKMRPVIIMDSDDAGVKATRKIAEMFLDAGIMPKVVRLEAGKDMADMSLIMKEEMEGWISNNSIYYWQYLLAPNIEQYSAKISELRQQLLIPAHSVLSRCDDAIQRDLIVNYLKDQTGLEVLV